MKKIILLGIVVLSIQSVLAGTIAKAPLNFKNTSNFDLQIETPDTAYPDVSLDCGGKTMLKAQEVLSCEIKYDILNPPIHAETLTIFRGPDINPGFFRRSCDYLITYDYDQENKKYDLTITEGLVSYMTCQTWKVNGAFNIIVRI